jgi:hypothetical protein
MGLSDWWEKRQARKQQEENAKLLDLAEHPQGTVEGGDTDIDELRTDLGTSKMGEMSMDDAHHIE